MSIFQGNTLIIEETGHTKALRAGILEKQRERACGRSGLNERRLTWE